jgi:hypothetical protein
MSNIAFNPLILGNGPYSRALAQLLGVPSCVVRKADDSGWKWGNRRGQEPVSLIMVADPKWSQSQIVRYHAEAWSYPGAKQIQALVLVLDHDGITVSLLKRDVFGRMGEMGESFSDWEPHVTVLSAFEGLGTIANCLSSLELLPVATWQAAAARASVLPALCKAIRAHDLQTVRALLPSAQRQDWDAVCPHSHANRIRTWMCTMTQDVTHDWVEGEAVIRPLYNQQ